MTGFTPIKDRVLVRMDARKEQTAGGIVLPEFSQTTETWGEVCAVGNKVEDLRTGDRVMVESHVGTHVVVKGVDYILIEESRVKVMQQQGA
jgi:chaperonin GroES